MVTPRRETETADEPSRGECGLPGGGRGRIDVVGRTGVYPGSGPYPGGAAAIRTPASFVHGKWDAEGRQVEGGSELTYLGGDILLGGATPPSSSPPGVREIRDPGARSERGDGADERRELPRPAPRGPRPYP